MVAVMVEQFRDMQLLLAGTIERYETAEFKALDDGISRVFDAIYRHEPQNMEEARILIRLFLDIIENNDAGDNIYLIDRVRTIVDGCGDPRLPPMEILHGAGI